MLNAASRPYKRLRALPHRDKYEQQLLGRAAGAFRRTFIKRAAECPERQWRARTSAPTVRPEVEHELQVWSTSHERMDRVNSYGLETIAQDVLGAIGDHRSASAR